MKHIMIGATVGYFLFLSGCAATSPFPMNDSQALKSDSEFGSLTAQPDVFKGRAIKLAGRMVGVESTDEGTFVTAEWLPYPEAEYLGPYKTTEGSPERFVIFYPGKLDSKGQLYGNKFLVYGKNEGKPLGERASASVPYITARCLHVWKTGLDRLDTRPDTEYTQYDEETYCADT